MNMLPKSLPSICSLELFRGDQAQEEPPALLIELPHGATAPEHYFSLRDRLLSPLPDMLEHFFYVNTDVGSYECAVAIALEVVRLQPKATVAILRSLIPRTFIDCNRQLDLPPEAFKEGRVSPAWPSYIRAPDDQRLLRQMHQAYQAEACAAYDWICGFGGLALMLHTYAPRTVSISSVGHDIVEQLHKAYEPDTFQSWKLRPEMDVICNTPDGEELAAIWLLPELTAHMASVGIPLSQGATYPLHPVTTGYHHARRHSGKTLCIEIRRDLLMNPYTPFSPMTAEKGRLSRFSIPIAATMAKQIHGRTS
jgi:hypothetical protein